MFAKLLRVNTVQCDLPPQASNFLVNMYVGPTNYQDPLHKQNLHGS